MPTMWNIEKDAAGKPIVGKHVTIAILPLDTVVYFDDEYSVEAIGDVITDLNGRWEFDTDSTSNASPMGVAFSAMLRFRNGIIQHIFEIPDQEGEHWIGDWLTEEPGAVASSALSSHMIDPTAAHGASAIASSPVGTILATNVQAALSEVDSRITSSVSTLNATITTQIATVNATITSQVATLNTAIATKANDNSVVKLTGDQTVSGVKSFDGSIIIGANVAPADGTIPTSKFSIWWDNTPTTGGFRIKGKDSAGTVLSHTFVLTGQTQGGTLAAPVNTAIWTWQPRDPAKGPFGIQMIGANFGTTWDNVMEIGYNIGVGGGQAIPNEPIFRLNIEQDYWDGVKHTLEAYFEWVPKSGLFADTKRPLFWQFNRDTGANTAFTMQAESVNFLRWSDGAPMASFGAGTFNISAVTGLPTSLSLSTPSGQGSAFYMQHGASNALAVSTLSAAIVAFNVGTGSAELYIFQGAGVSINLFDNTQALGVESSGGSRTVAIRANVSQVGAQTEWQDSTGAYGTKIDKNNYFMSRKNSAPADADVAANEMALWFDATNGAAKLMVKAKQADGTVRSGSLALA